MPFKKRSNIPPQTASEASEHSDTHTDARHVSLQGIRLDIYRFIEANPKCTRADIVKGLRLMGTTATARVKELIDEGYLFEPYGVRKENLSGVRAKVLMVTNRQQGGKPLDKVRIELALTIDCNGVYGVHARVVSGGLQHGRAHLIKKQSVTITAPHPDTYESAISETQTSRVSPMDTQHHAHDIIEAVAYEVNE